MRKMIILLTFYLVATGCLIAEHSIESINLILAEGSDLEVKDTKGWTPLI